MANLRNLKKEIDYRLEEFVFDCEMAIYFQPSKEEAIFALMQKQSTFALLAIVVFFIFCSPVVICDYRMAKWKDVVTRNLKNHNIL